VSGNFVQKADSMAQGQNKGAGHNPFQSSLCGMEVSQMEEVFWAGQVCVGTKLMKTWIYVVWLKGF